MLQSAFKLFCLSLAIFGPFVAGILYGFVREPEIYLIFLVGFVLLGVGGVCGFASIERDEARRHRLARFGREL